MTKLLSSLIIGLMLAVMAGQLAIAQSGASFIKEGTINGIPYLSGGVGWEERVTISRMAKGYNLKLTFATSAGAYLSNLMVGIRDRRGKLLLEMESNGPWFLAKLPKGRYRITVALGDQKKVQRVKVGEGLSKVVLNWQP